MAPPRERCENCDAEIDEDYKFCPACGEDLKGKKS
ncbi:MAG: zinc-ribbon domain-containing protein [Desulfobacterales bacterium]|nr:zinc-ribbon domain-containing protein [Desulfobacterales bacterium]